MRERLGPFHLNWPERTNGKRSLFYYKLASRTEHCQQKKRYFVLFTYVLSIVQWLILFVN